MQDRQQTVNEHIYFLGTGVRMIELGKKQKLLVVKTVDFGIYLGEDRPNRYRKDPKQVMR